MKNIMIFICLYAFYNSLLGQSKQSNTWVLGYFHATSGYTADTTNFGGQFLKFETGQPKIERFRMQYGPATGVANDETGNLLFYTTGCKIINKHYEVMDNGHDIDSGADNSENCPFLGGAWFIKNGTFVLPDVQNKDLFLVLNLRFSRTTDTSYLLDKLLYSKVDMSANNGLGRVIEKNQTIITDSLHNQIAVTRHGNGRDWWVIVPRGVGREFWRVLITPQGISSQGIVNVLPPQPAFSIRHEWADSPGTYWIPNEYAWEAEATAAFSPDGSKYCVAVLGTGFEIYDFDRCSGALTFRRLIPIPSYIAYPNAEVTVNSVGAAFSPNSRYLYYNNGESMFQLDLCEECLEKAEPFLLAVWDGYLSEGFPANFFNMRNAPDGKIYINSPSSTKTLHVINEPNKRGLACDFQQHAIEFPYRNSWILNNFPNFDLYDLPDSPCDILGIDDPNRIVKVEFDALKIYPNPANTEVKIYIPGCEEGYIKIWNMASQLMAELKNITGEEVYSFSTKSWPAGLYIFETHINNETPTLKKVVIVH